MKKFIFLGMAIQATIVGLAVLTGSSPKPGQYFFLAGILILLFILLKLQEKKKKKEKLPKSKSGRRLMIDCDADPFIPKGWKIVEHKKGGRLKFDPAKLSLYLSKEQSGKKTIIGNDLRNELADKPVMNANVLDYLLHNPELIPESWKDKAVFFWGTIYRHSSRSLYVRCLIWDGFECLCDDHWLNHGFGSDDPAALSN